MLSWFSRIFKGVGAESAQVGGAVAQVAEVFTANKTKRDQLEADAFQSAVNSHAAEFRLPARNWFDSFINGINRLPRPLMALGTIALFVYAIAEPDQFAQRMVGIVVIPEPMWWLIGVIVAFYFGARESHHLRMNNAVKSVTEAKVALQAVQKDDKSATVNKSELTDADDLDEMIDAEMEFNSNPVLDQLLS